MLDQNDLKSIEKIIGATRDGLKQDMQGLRTELKQDMQGLRTELKQDMQTMKEEITVAVGEVIEQQILPQIGALDEKVEKLDRKVSKLDASVARLDTRAEKLESRVEKLDAKVDKLPTKDEVSDKLSDLRGDLVIKTQRVDAKVEALADLGHKRSVFTDTDITDFKQKFSIFPQHVA